MANAGQFGPLAAIVAADHVSLSSAVNAGQRRTVHKINAACNGKADPTGSILQ
jgi:hypothetical protein